MPADKMQPVITDPFGHRRARRQAHNDAEADQHAERGKAPTVDGPPPPRNRALIDPRESHWWRLSQRSGPPLTHQAPSLSSGRALGGPVGSWSPLSRSAGEELCAERVVAPLRYRGRGC